MRLQKFLADHGVDSRRKCEEHIKEGRVKVNNKVITEMGYIIDPNRDRISFDGKTISGETKQDRHHAQQAKGRYQLCKGQFQ